MSRPSIDCFGRRCTPPLATCPNSVTGPRCVAALGFHFCSSTQPPGYQTIAHEQNISRGGATHLRVKVTLDDALSLPAGAAVCSSSKAYFLGEGLAEQVSEGHGQTVRKIYVCRNSRDNNPRADALTRVAVGSRPVVSVSQWSRLCPVLQHALMPIFLESRRPRRLEVKELDVNESSLRG